MDVPVLKVKKKTHQMSLALLHNSEDTKSNEVGALTKDIGQFEKSRIDENRKRIFGEKSRKFDDGLALSI